MLYGEIARVQEEILRGQDSVSKDREGTEARTKRASRPCGYLGQHFLAKGTVVQTLGLNTILGSGRGVRGDLGVSRSHQGSDGER